MLIAVATLTIATANATNWLAPAPTQIVNNTSVQLEFRTWPSSQYFTLQPNTSASLTNAGDTQVFFGWGVDDTSAGPVILTQSFDDTQQTGSMSDASVAISGIINLGTAWHISNFGYNDTLTIDSYYSSGSTTMDLLITRERGVTVKRGNDASRFEAYVFCVNTSAYFELENDGDSGRCPVGENEVIMADEEALDDIDDNKPLDAWTATDITPLIRFICDYHNGCVQQWPFPGFYTDGKINGQDIKGFDTVDYDPTNNSELNLSILQCPAGIDCHYSMKGFDTVDYDLTNNSQLKMQMKMSN